MLINPRWVKACGKLPRNAPLAGSISSAYSPTSLAHSRSRSKSRVRRLAFALREQRVHLPEAAHEERTLAALQPVVAPVAQQKVASGKLALDHQACSADRGHVERQAEHGELKQGAARHPRLRGRRRTAAGARRRDGARARGSRPRCGRAAAPTRAALASSADGAVEHHPAHRLGVDEVARLAAHLPDAASRAATSTCGDEVGDLVRARACRPR